MRLFLIALALAPAAASAHVTLEMGEAPATSTYKAVLRIPHGCDGAATHTVRVALPDGFVGAKPMPKPGWALEVVRGAYPTPYTLHGETVGEGPREIVWSGGTLADDWYDEFVVRGTVADLPAGTTLPFRVTQLCEGASVTWDEVAAPGVDPHSLAHPAPVLTVAQAGADAGGHGASGAGMNHAGMDHAGMDHAGMAEAAPAATGHATVGPLVIDAAWTRATPPGADVAGGYMTITNTGTAPDRLLGGSVPFAHAVQVHEMTVENGMMKMGEIPGGLAIAPGETVTLAPGGYHLMFMGLSEAPAAGGTVPVTLRFEAAGEVTLDLPVAPMGASTPPRQGPAN